MSHGTRRTLIGLTLGLLVPTCFAWSAPHIELVASDLGEIVSMAWDSSGRIFYTERGGRVRLIVGGQVVPTPVLGVEVDTDLERGLHGIALDPDFDDNHYVYITLTATDDPATNNRLIRFTEVDGVGQDPVILWAASANTRGPFFAYHNIESVRFGPDGKLYFSIGDDATESNALDLADKHGKIHRLNADGTIPTDNPFYGREGAEWSIYAVGLRNSFDFDWDPVTGNMVASENGPFCDDEVNLILPGQRYGWRPSYPCGDTDTRYNSIPPMYRWTPTIGPTGIAFYTGDLLPPLQGKLFMCDFNNGDLHYLRLNEARTRVVQDAHVPLPGDLRCNMDVKTGPDGALYFVMGGGWSSGDLYRIVP